MLRLPIELRRLCIEALDDHADTLKELRLANKEIGTIATEILFRKAVLNPTDESAQALMDLMQSPHSQNVRCVVINTCIDPGAEPESELLESYADVIALLCSFKNLEELRLNFTEECADEKNDLKEVTEDQYWRSKVLETVFKALEKASTLKTLSIRDLQDLMDRKILESEAFQTVRGRLTGLHLQITTEQVEQHELDFEALHQGFTIDLPELWLKPVLSHLTSLTLYSYTSMWGLYPFIDFREVGTFPCLESLCLGNFTIAHDWQIDWILSHGPTLKQLLLDDCPIITALRMTDEDDMVSKNFPGLQKENSGYCPYFKLISLRWHDVFDRFQSGLSQLQRFAWCGSDIDWTDDCFDHRYTLTNRLNHNRYQVFDRGTALPWSSFEKCGSRTRCYRFYIRGFGADRGYLEMEPPLCDDEDLGALTELMSVVDERARLAM